MTETTFAQREGKHFGCPQCGGGLRYDIASGQMKCDHCGSLTAIGSLPADQTEDGSMEVTEFRCPQCGAAVYSSETAMTSFCSFCGSDVVLTAKLTRTRRPFAIVPFQVSREQCEERYRRHLNKYHLVPKAYKAAETISHFRAVYVPFWRYHVQSEGQAKLKATRSYTRGDTQYNETYALTVDAVIDQKDILYDASSAFEDETAAMLRHTADSAVPFHSAYLSGFFAQAADVAADTYYAEAAATAVRMFIDKVKKQNKYDTITTDADASGYFGLPKPRFDQELIMLPVWLLAHRDADRVVYTAVNGCTGDVVCDVPVGLQRVAGVAVTLSAALFAALSLLLTIKPDLLMALCAALSLLTQFRFSAMHQLLYNRKTRAFEPGADGGRRSFVGPAQQLLKKSGATGASSVFKKAGGALLGIAFVIFAAVGNNLLKGGSLRRIVSVFSSGGSRFTDALPAIVMGLCLIVMVIHTAMRMSKPGGGTPIPRVLSCLLCGAGLYFVMSRQAEDLLFYAVSAGLLAAAIWELILIIRGHNEYASRPVPYFDGKENPA